MNATAAHTGSLPTWLVHDRPVWLVFACTILLQLALTVQAVRSGELIWVFAPVVVLAGILIFLQPQWGLLVLTASWFTRVPLSSAVGVYPADIVLVIVAAGYIVRQLTTGRPILYRTPIDRWLLIFIGTLTISWLLSVNKAVGFVNWGHHLEVLLFYFVVVGLATEISMHRVLAFFVGLSVVLSVWNINTFIQAGGNIRAFGPAGVLFTGILSLVATYSTSRFLLAERSSTRRLWGATILVLVLGEVVTQSRGGMIQMMSGMVFASYLAAKWGKIHNQPHIRRRMVQLASTLTLTAVILLAIFTPVLLHILTRYSTTQGNALATANMRIFLWKTALHLFSEYPLFGVGLAQENLWAHLFPAMRFDPWFLSTQGLSFHNSMLGYLASTGIVGSLALLTLLVKTVLMGVPLLPRIVRQEEAAWKLGVWAVVFVIVTRYLYEGHLFYSLSGIVAATFFAFLGRLLLNLKVTQPAAEGT